jgi:hypothetical protein
MNEMSRDVLRAIFPTLKPGDRLYPPNSDGWWEVVGPGPGTLLYFKDRDGFTSSYGATSFGHGWRLRPGRNSPSLEECW